MRYCIARFEREIPTVEGVTHIASLTTYQIYSVDEDSWDDFTGRGQPWEEITELEATQGTKFYGEVREYRKAYSLDEGLEPDEDENGKTKVYFTDEIHAATVSLMKKVFKKMIQDVYDTRDDRDGEDALLEEVDGLTNIRDINKKREEYLGIEMPRAQLRELGLWDEEAGSRDGVCDYSLGF